MDNLSITYIINTCNRGYFLKQNIQDQILSKHFDIAGINFDIIIVDDGSIDGTFGKIKPLCVGKLGIPIKYIYLKRRIRNCYYSDSVPKNTAVSYSNSKFIYVADSDCYICNSDIFHHLFELHENEYLCPNMFRINYKKEFYDFCSKNWMHPLKCLEHFKKFGHISTECYYPTIYDEKATQVIPFKSGLFGMHRETFHNIGGIPPIRTPFGTDEVMQGLIKEHNIILNEDANSKLFVVHFPIKYAKDFFSICSPYIDEHYEQINGITILKKEFLDVYELTL